MVEIIPYIEDDEDTSTWIPLTAPSTNAATTATAANTTEPSDKANVDECDTQNSYAVLKGVEPIQEGNGEAVQSNIHTIVENVNSSDDDDQDWEKLPSQSSQAHQSESIKSTSAAAVAETWSLTKQIISHLTTASSSHTDPSAIDEDASTGEENIAWSRPNQIDDGESFDRWNETRKAYQSSSISQNQFAQQYHRPQSTTNNQHQERPHTDQNEQCNNRTQHRQAAKDKLKQTLVHDPLQALPLCFLRNFYHETKHELALAWDAYFQNNEVHTIAAPLTLFVILALFGVGLIGNGLSRLLYLAVTTSLEVGVSFFKFMVHHSLRMTAQLAWLSVVLSVIVGASAWIWVKTTEKATTTNIESSNTIVDAIRIPTVSTILPWVAAFSLPSVVEALVIMLSLRSFLSILFFEDLHSNRCLSSDVYDLVCSIENTHDVRETSSLAVYGLSLVVALITSFSISASANAFELEENDQSSCSELFGMARIDAYVNTSLCAVQKHLRACHAVAIITLASLSMALLIAQTVYMHEGGSLMYAVMNGLGTIGCNIVCVAMGILILVSLAKTEIAILSQTANEDESRIISFQQTARAALKKALIEVASKTVWTEDDGTLRLAMLEWILDRWSSSRCDDESPKSTTTSSSAEPIAQSESDNSSTSGSSIPTSTPANEESTSGTSGSNQSTILSYQSLQKIVSKLDADDSLIPAIDLYRAWVYSLPPSRNSAMFTVLWRICPATAVFLLSALWCIGLAVLTRISGLLHETSLLASAKPHLMFQATVTILAPLLCLEYQRVRRWWKKVMIDIQSNRSEDTAEQTPESLIILFEVDADDPSDSFTNFISFIDQSSVVKLQKAWSLFLESISLLESTIPVVRCATVACTAADLTSDAVCLIDLAVEINKSGLIGGVGMLLWDAFHYHLSVELHQRKDNDNLCGEGGSEEDQSFGNLGGKYTGAAVKAVGNVEKLAHNIKCLHAKKSSSDGASVNRSSDECELATKAETDAKVELKVSQDSNKNVTAAQSQAVVTDPSCEISDENKCQNPIIATNQDIKQEDVDTSDTSPPINDRSIRQDKDETTQTETNEEEGDNMMPVWIGGGLALLGAVVGGIAVAANNNQHNGDRKRRKPSNEPS